MNSLNTAQIIGNLTRDPELKSTQNGQSVCTLGVATNRRWTDSSSQKHEEPEYHNIVCWGKLAEICAEYLKKGTKVFFSGRLKTRTWEDDAGTKHYRTEIVAEDMIILSPKGSHGGGGSYAGDDASGDTASTPEPKAVTTDDEISPEDLPF